MGSPVSWLVIERGWKVVAADGGEIGSVEEVIGDTTKDIFNGLAVSTGLLSRARYVPAERVREIVEGRVEVDVAADEVDDLDEYGGAPTSERIRPDDV